MRKILWKNMWDWPFAARQPQCWHQDAAKSQIQLRRPPPLQVRPRQRLPIKGKWQNLASTKVLRLPSRIPRWQRRILISGSQAFWRRIRRWPRLQTVRPRRATRSILTMLAWRMERLLMAAPQRAMIWSLVPACSLTDLRMGWSEQIQARSAVWT